MESTNTRKYTFTNYFNKVFQERTGLELNEDRQALILMACQNYKPHRKIDNKGRNSEYFTIRIDERLVTIVCDSVTHKIITCIIETHNRKEFSEIE